MNTGIAAKTQTKWLAGVVASIANVLLLVGVISLADHYARAAADVQVEPAPLAQQMVTAPSRDS